MKLNVQFYTCWLRGEFNVGLKNEGKIMARLLSTPDEHRVTQHQVVCLLQAWNVIKNSNIFTTEFYVWPGVLFQIHIQIYSFRKALNYH